MPYLIDGYNLLYAMGAIPKRAGPHGLEKARLRLLGLLHSVYGDDAAHVTVVFDAAHAPPGAVGEEEYHGVHVRFAVGHEDADELIESVIRHDSAPKQLTVVSDDHRIQQAARRRHCVVLGCLDYLDGLQRRRHQPSTPQPKDEKRTASSAEEVQEWLKAFAADGDHPAANELEYPYNLEHEKLPDADDE